MNRNYLIIGGGVLVAAAGWWFLRKKSANTSGNQPIDITVQAPATGGGGSSVTDLISNMLDQSKLAPISTIMPNSTNGSIAVDVGVTAPVQNSAPAPAPAVAQDSGVPWYQTLRDEEAAAKAAGLPSGSQLLFDPVVQKYSSEFAANNVSGGGQVWAASQGGFANYYKANS